MPRWLGLTSRAMSSTVSGTTPSHRDRKIKLLFPDRPYVLAEAEGGARRATILATGSEVSLAVKARSLLQAEGVPTAVVSMPSWELFEAQDEAYRREVLGPATARVAVEAAVRLVESA